MKVAIFQTNPILLDVQGNLDDVLQKIDQAKQKGVQLIVFPELALTGYFVGQRYHEVALRMDSREIGQIVTATRGAAAVVGFIEESNSMNFYNSALVAVDGKLLYAYRKLNLPNYGVFEERKYFSTGKQVPVFRLDDMNFSVFICNDLWHPSIPYLGVTQKADVFITIFNSSQGSMGTEFSNIESWGIINKFYSRVFGIYNICANRVGEEVWKESDSMLATEHPSENGALCKTYEEEKMRFKFWGGSEIINPFGQQIAKAALHKEDAIYGEISRDLLRQKRILLPYLREDDPYFTHRELQRILYGKKNKDFVL
ncbi:MAG: nitrilase [Deltaproteobacteria bacterium]|jgi:predicted amidohydrolase|nr:nitrilase [Deltaproteobacteria bacterium]